MKHKFFQVPVCDSLAAENELNAFVAQHRIIHVDKHFVADAGNSFWSVCVTWLDSEGALTDSMGKRKQKIDYKEVLNETDFLIYARLRDLRKVIAEREGTPVYNIFTNEQLAAMVQQQILTKSALLAVEGIGQTRVEKYGNDFLDCINASLQSPKSNEADINHP
jgi:superfamily II DNA helicase RecQ